MNFAKMALKPTKEEQEFIDSLEDLKNKIKLLEIQYDILVQKFLINGFCENLEQVEKELYDEIANYNAILKAKGITRFNKLYPLGNPLCRSIEKPEIGSTRKILELEYEREKEIQRQILIMRENFGNNKQGR